MIEEIEENKKVDFDKYLKEFKQDLIITGYSSKTIKAYSIYVNDLLKNLKKNPENITERDIIGYLAQKKENGNTNSTIALIHAAYRYFFKEYLKNDIISNIKTPKKAKSLPKILTKNEIKQLFDATKFGRNRLMLKFIYGSGCRVSEVVKLKIEDINYKERTAIIRGGKGNKDRMILLSKKWLIELKKYLKRKKVKSEFVFSKKNGKNLSTDTIQRIIKESAKKANMKKNITPHILRHSYATHLLESGTNIRYIQNLLGHSNLNTTQIYTNVASEKLKKIKSPLDIL